MKELCNGCLNYFHCPLKRDLSLPLCRNYISIMEFVKFSFDLSNANGYNEYQEFMEKVMSGKVVLNGSD